LDYFALKFNCLNFAKFHFGGGICHKNLASSAKF